MSLNDDKLRGPLHPDGPLANRARRVTRHKMKNASAAGKAKGKTFGWSPVKVGRNAPCPCKSGKKFKRCCGGPKLYGDYGIQACDE